MASLTCPRGHLLQSSQIPVEWNCDGCRAHMLPSMSYNCRKCNFDMCLGCITRGSHNGASRAGDGGCGGGRCPSAHPLTKGFPPAVWNCDVCHHRFSPDVNSYSCRGCNFDVCTQCLAAMEQKQQQQATTTTPQESSTPSSTVSCSALPIGSMRLDEPSNKPSARCPSGHPLEEGPVPSNWNCDMCHRQFAPGVSLHCRRCNFDACTPCSKKLMIANDYDHNKLSSALLHTSAAPPIITRPYSASAPASGSAKALKCVFIGINYSRTSNQLSGCISDVCTLRALLQSLKYDVSNSRVLIDDPAAANNLVTRVHAAPTKRAILEAMDWLVEGASPGDNLFFHYSGHGAQLADQDGDEADGFDETLVPLDFQSAGQIRDDEIFMRLVAKVPKGARLTGVVDACHSGSVFDLPLVFRPPSSSVSPQSSLCTVKTKSHGRFESEGSKQAVGDVLLISGCKDSQTSADVKNAAQFLHSSGGGSSGVFKAAASSGNGGACTLSLVEVLRQQGYGTKSYTDVLVEMISDLKARRMQQLPQFSSTKEFEFGSKFSFSGPL